MATSGQAQTNTAFGWVKLEWSTSSQSVENNTSTVAYTLSIYRSSDISSTAAKSYSITINGVKVASGTTTIGGSGTKVIKTGTTTISHNADGTKTFSFSFSQQVDITWSGSWIGTITGSGSGSLNTLPRATTPTLSISTVAMGSAVTITMNRASNSFTHTLTYSFGGASGTVGTGIATQKTWTVPLTLANQIPNATSGTGTITCYTYNGSTLIGTKSVSFVATVPISVIPTISGVSIKETVSGLAAKFNGFVQLKSKVQVAITATGAYSSTIQSYKTTVDGKNYTGNNQVTEALSTSGTVTVTTTVTDSRGRTATATNNITVLAYSPPKITSFTAFRANSDGTQNYEGTHTNIAYKFDISSVNSLNDKYYEIVYRLKGSSTWSFITSGTDIYSADTSVISDAVFDADNAYDLAINIYDYFGEDHITLDIPTAFTLMDFRSTGKGVAFGKVSESDRMEIALDIELTGELIQEAKQTPSLQNGWVNYGTAYESASYWKDTCGVVHLAGLIKSGTTTAETVIFNLPLGYRPRAPEKFFSVSLNAICVIDIYSSGDVAIKTGANSGWLSLSGISFKAV